MNAPAATVVDADAGAAGPVPLDPGARGWALAAGALALLPLLLTLPPSLGLGLGLAAAATAAIAWRHPFPAWLRAVLTLANNYHSVELIIRDAEALLGDVQHKQQKPSQAIKTTQPGDHGIRLIQRFDSKANLPELLKQISEQCAYAAERNWTRDCRSRPIPPTVPTVFKPKWRSS